MGLFKYLAAETGAAPREVVIEADTAAEALIRLRRRNLFPIRDLGEVSAVQPGAFQWRRKRIDVFGFTNQLAPLLTSHIPLERALMIIAESSEHPDQNHYNHSDSLDNSASISLDDWLQHETPEHRLVP